MSPQRVVAGIDIGGTSTSVLLIGDDGVVLAEGSCVTPASVSGEAMVTAAAELVKSLEEANGLYAGAVGIGAAGVVDSQARRVVAASSTFVGWAGCEVGTILDGLLGVPNSLENDVNAFLLGEVAHGAGNGQANIAGITLGTGVGGALLLNGELWSGPNGAAGELGHTPGFSIPGLGLEPCTCGQTGHLESIASGLSIARRYRERVSSPGIQLSLAQLRGSDVSDLARSGDEDARQVLLEAGLMVGQAAVSLATMLDVNHLVVGGGVTEAWDLIEPGIASYAAGNPPVSGAQVSVSKAFLGNRAVAVGAASQARALLASV